MTASKSPLTIAQILAWADQYHEWCGRWPISRSGPVLGAPDRTWEGINTALRKGGSGLPGGSSLARVLEQKRGVCDTRRTRPDLNTHQILQWADDHHQRAGAWPDRNSGPIVGATDIAWATVDRYLRHGGANFAGGSSLNHLLREARGVWDGGKPMLTVKLVLKWADAHFARTGRWPVTLSGDVHGAPGENWAAVDMALRNARRGIHEPTSLSRILTEHRGRLYKPAQDHLTIRQIMAWAESHRRRKGRWPTRKSGPVIDAPRLTWSAINTALERGTRGLPGGSSLSRLLHEEHAMS